MISAVYGVLGAMHVVEGATHGNPVAIAYGIAYFVLAGAHVYHHRKANDDDHAN